MTREPLTLASTSPRRRQLLEMLGIPLRVVPSDVPEVRRPTETPLDYVERLAREKALGVRGRLVLGADTTVILRDEVLEKPLDEADALRLGRQTQWKELAPGLVQGVGQRLWLVGDDVRPILEIQEVSFAVDT